MSSVFYRSANDGWRVGLAESFNNVTTVVVKDAVTGLIEHVRPSDVFVPKDVQRRLKASQPEAENEQNEQHGQEEGQQHAEGETEEKREGDAHKDAVVQPETRARSLLPAPKDESQLLHMENHKQYWTREDVTDMDPSPTELPPLVAALRVRFQHQVDTTFLGDNFAVNLRKGSFSPTVGMGSGAGLAARAVAALKSSKDRNPQLITAFGDGTFAICSDAALTAAKLLGATDAEIQRLRAAHTILQVFTHGVNGNQRVLRRVTICRKKHPSERKSSRKSNDSRSPSPTAENKSQQDNSETRSNGRTPPPQQQQNGAPQVHEAVYGCSQFDYSFFDTQHVVECPESNYLMLAFCVYAFDNEEKERCYIPKRTKNWLAVNEITDPDVLAMLRERYFAFTKAMDLIGFEVSVLLTICARVAAVLHLLNIEFDEDGAPLTMTSLKNAARLIQTDFNSLSKILVNKETCQEAAKLLYYSTFHYLLRKVNELLNPKGIDGEPLVTVLGLPQAIRNGPKVTPTLRSLMANTMYEDVFQAFYRTSDLEMVQWQEQGFVASSDLQFVFDHVDNYPVLKALKAKGGALKIFLSDPEGKDLNALSEALRVLGRYKVCAFDEANYTLTIKHSFGPVTYQLPKTEADWKALRSVFHDDFTELRSYLVQSCDVETQEALCLVEQEDEDRRKPNVFLQLWVDLNRTFFDLITDQRQTTWWASVIHCPDSKFSGEHVAKGLTDGLAHAALELRALMPSRFIPVEFSHVSTEFKSLLPSSYVKASDPDTDHRLRAEAICVVTQTPHVVGKTALLLQASAIARLHAKQREHLDKAATKVQGCLRGIGAAAAVNRRITRWTSAVARIEEEQEEIEQLHKWRAEHAERHHVQRLMLQEEEHRARVALRDTYWVEWVALETERETQLENLIQCAIAAAISAENTLALRTIEDSHKKAVAEINARVKERLVRQGARLDHVAREQIAKGKGARKELEKLEEAHDRILRMRLAQEEAKIELEAKVRSKGQRYKTVLVDRERRREALRDELWMRQERDRAVRMHMENTREQVAMHMKQNLEMDTIERQLAARLQQEIRDRQRSERDAAKRSLHEARLAKEKKLEQTARTAEQIRIREERAEAERKQKEEEMKRLEGKRLLVMQNREREAAERAREEDLKRQKILTRTLLKAHNMMLDPAIYQQTSKGAKLLPETSRSRSASRGLAEGFTMSRSKVTYPHLLDDDTWKGIASYHSEKIEGSQNNSACRQRGPSTGRRSAAARSASPKSILSL